MEKRTLLDVNTALELVLDGVKALEPEMVSLPEAGGRFTAHAVVSLVDQPGFDNSAMDGYAAIASDTEAANNEHPLTLDLVGESRAGLPFAGLLESGQTVAVSTGAVVPSGADAVLQKEIVDVLADSGQIRVSSRVEAGRDIRWQGAVTKAGNEVLAAGVEIGAVELGVLASAGQNPVSCHGTASVSLLTSGDELVEPGSPLEPGQIWNSNRFVVAEMVHEAGAGLASSATMADDRDATVEALRHALQSDLTVVCGGVSVGDHDHVRPALAELGIEQLFWGLALKPGRPTWFGRSGKSYVLGLPGNPVSALVVFRLLGLPLLRKLAGAPEPLPRKTARLAASVERHPGRLRAVPCHIAGEDRPDELMPMEQLGSHDFLSMVGATKLALIKPGSGNAEAGDVVETVSMGDRKSVV